MMKFILTTADGKGSIYQNSVTGALQWGSGAPVEDGIYRYVKGFSWDKGEQGALRRLAEKYPETYQPLLEQALEADGTPDYAPQIVKEGYLYWPSSSARRTMHVKEGRLA